MPGPAIDTVACFSTQAGAGAFPLALAAAPNDSLTVRNFAQTDSAQMLSFIYDSNAVTKCRVSSPMLHDNVTGLTFFPSDQPAAYQLGREVGVNLTPTDTLGVFGATTAAGTAVAGLVNYYSNLPGTSARLHSWGDISGIIQYIKAIEVDLLATAVGAWTDTPLTQTENQLHSDFDYAILGYECSQAIDIVAFKGQATGNLRVGGPGVAGTLDLTDYFIRQNQQRGLPVIPVFNANDRNAFYVSSFHKAAIAGAAATVSVIVAQLSTTVTP